jgi:hypothetical protein
MALVFTAVQLSTAQQMRSFKPKHAVICYQSFEEFSDHIGVSGKFRQMRQLSAARTKTATFEVQYINFPADNLAKNAFQYAVEIWESELISPVPVRIIAEWKPLDAGVLGQALWGRAYANFGGEQNIDTFYPVALAEKITGRELNDTGEADIVASFNSNASWYFATDGNTPAGKMDLVTIVLHEIAHGLGFTDTYDAVGTQASVGLENGGLSVPFVFDVFVENQTNKNLVSDFQSPSAALLDALQSTNLFFNSPLALSALSGVRPELFAPATFNKGSSISHLDETVFSASGDANRLMTPHIAFGESIHNPGNVLLGVLGDMGWINTSITHVPLKDTEVKNGQPYIVKALIRSDNGYNASQVKLHYTTDGVNYTVVNMTSTGTANEFKSSLPGTTVDLSYGYFISVVDGASRTFTNPGKTRASGKPPEQETHFFNIGPDMAAPLITHEPVSYILNDNTTLSLTAEVTDNLGVKEVIVEYSINAGAVQSKTMIKGTGTDEYTVSIALPALKVGDEIQYRIMATDLSSAQNTGQHPTEGHHHVAVNGLLPAQDSYSNDFNQPTVDFFGNGFSIATPFSFEDGAIHSDHPYNNGTGINQESNYIFQLQIPIRIRSSNPLIRFDEIVLVEPGEDGSEFGDPDFFDYVVVEGSNDGGNSWKPFAPGYDSRAVSVWLSRYNEDVVDDNSQSTGDPELFRSRTINLVESNAFAAGDEVLIRFRLFADALAHGWGWAIDNLFIQGLVTDVEESLESTLKVYPVPVSSDLFVEFAHANAGAVSVEISDPQGRILYTEKLFSAGGLNKRTIPVQFLKDGMYQLKAKQGNDIYVRKFLKLTN